MKAATFSCDVCGGPFPVPCACRADPYTDEHCTDCGSLAPFVQIAPGTWVCTGCIAAYRSAARGEGSMPVLDED